MVQILNITDMSSFNVFYWDRYEIDGDDFDKYIIRPDADVDKILAFLSESSIQAVLDVEEISIFLLYYPNSYFLVGGRGHWSYAINENLLKPPPPPFPPPKLGGGINNDQNKVGKTKRVISANKTNKASRTKKVIKNIHAESKNSKLKIQRIDNLTRKHKLDKKTNKKTRKHN